MMSRKKMLVTGGSGFIGGNFVQYMVQHYPNYDIYNLDVLTYAADLRKHKAIETKPNYFFIHGDITDFTTIYSLFKKEQFDFVVHFAAESHVDRSIQNPSIFTHTNVLGTQVLLEAAKQVGIEKFIHISTDEVYGELEWDEPTLFTEETPLQPNSPYSASKASSDLLVLAYFKTYGMPINITRCSNNYGPFQYPEKLIPLTILRALKDEKISVYGNGENIRDWLHVMDHCKAIDLVVHEGISGEIYNVGGNNEWQNIEIVKIILQSLGKSEELITFVRDRLGHDKRYGIDATKLQRLGWKPKYTFDKGISETIQWYLNNEDWWGPILNKSYQTVQ